MINKINSFIQQNNEMPFKTVKVNRFKFDDIFKSLCNVMSSTSLGWMSKVETKKFIFSLFMGFHIFPISNDDDLNKELDGIYHSIGYKEATFLVQKNNFIKHIDPARTEYGLLMVNELYKHHHYNGMDDAMEIRLYHALSFYALLLFGVQYSSEVDIEGTIGDDYYFNDFLQGMVDLGQYKDSLLDQLMDRKFN